MHKKILIAGAIFGALGVALGAFGAHGLQKLTQDEKILHGFQTDVPIPDLSCVRLARHRWDSCG